MAIALVFFFLSVHCAESATTGAARPRVIVTTDGEIDDQCSMVRFLLYTDEWDVLGIIHSSSKYHWKGDAVHKPHNWSDESWLERQIDAYEKVYPSLTSNNPGYPSPDALRNRVFEGNVAFEGDMEKPTPGSKRIVEVLLDSDPSPVWLLAWGGSNTIARALKTIEEKHPERVAEVARKARLFLITIQDNTLNTYLRGHWPTATLILSTDFGAIAYGWRTIMSPELQRYFDARWMNENILTGHGALCALYRAKKDGSFRSEGDSPSFMHLIDVGLDNRDHPSWGGWGGRFERWPAGYLRSAVDDGPGDWAILRWAKAFQNDWAVRADWCVKPFAQCNHAPKAVCNGDRSRITVTTRAAPGTEVRLDATGSTDPDDNRLTYKWGVYEDAGDYWAAPPIQNADSARATLRVPRDAAGRTIHVILEITDNGRPPLTGYRRVVIHVSGKPQPSPRERYLTTRVTRLSGPPAESGPWTFYRGVNLNGPPTSIDGHPWEGNTAPNVVCTDRALTSPQVPLRPPTDPARASMIHSFRWNRNASVTLTHVPTGTYAVYVYVWEDNNPETLAFSLNGKTVVQNHVSGIAGEWHRLGPWAVRVTDGTVHLAASNGAANLSGIEVWKRRR